MALFKILKGAASRLKDQNKVDGWAWLTPDDGAFYIDAENETTSEIERIRINPVSEIIEFVLRADNWNSSNIQTISSENIKSNSNGVLSLNTTDLNLIDMAAEAQIILYNQAEGYINLQALGSIPTEDIPVKILLVP